MTNIRDLYAGYEQAILGNRKEIPTFPFSGQKDQQSHRNRTLTISLYKYAGQYLMGWSRDQFKSLLTIAFEKDFMLYDLGQKYLDIPPNMNEEERRLYISHLCFPGYIHFDIHKLVTEEYERVLSDPKHSWKNNYFSNDTTGLLRANICLRHCLTKYFSFTDLETMYRLFDDEEKALVMLNKYCLKKASEKLYETPLEYLHTALSNYTESQDNFMYNYLRFKREYKTFQGA